MTCEHMPIYKVSTRTKSIMKVAVCNAVAVCNVKPFSEAPRIAIGYQQLSFAKRSSLHSCIYIVTAFTVVYP